MSADRANPSSYPGADPRWENRGFAGSITFNHDNLSSYPTKQNAPYTAVTTRPGFEGAQNISTIIGEAIKLYPDISTSDLGLLPDRVAATANNPNQKMDPFEVRIRFTQQLQSLNASVTSANKAAQYALKYRDMDEDLHSCIVEQLERNTMNNRANIMYFIEHLCDMAAREKHQDYIRMMQRDILKIVDAVAPEDGSGAANVKVVRRVLSALCAKNFLLAQTVSEIEDLLRERDTQDHEANEDVEMGGMGKTGGGGGGGVLGLKGDKKLIEQRIEEDRERHKRLRENIWAVPVGGGSEKEFEKMWSVTSDIGDDDYILDEEETEDERHAAVEWKELCQA